MITVQRSENYSKNAERKHDPDDLPCLVCGKAVKHQPITQYAHLIGGSELVLPGEDYDEAADLGYYPIGSDCLRRNPQLKPYVTTLD